MEVPPTRWAHATRQILVLGHQAPRKFSPIQRTANNTLFLSFSIFFVSFSLRHAQFRLQFILSLFFLSLISDHHSPSQSDTLHRFARRWGGQGRPSKGRKTERQGNTRDLDRQSRLENLFLLHVSRRYDFTHTDMRYYSRVPFLHRAIYFPSDRLSFFRQIRRAVYISSLVTAILPNRFLFPRLSVNNLIFLPPI